MGEIRIVGPGKTRGYPYPVCKKRTVGSGKTRGYPYPVCKKLIIMPLLAGVSVQLMHDKNKTSHTTIYAFNFFARI